MAIRNTKQDAANTAVRALLTAKGETYLGEKYTKGSKMWADILDDFFINVPTVKRNYMKEKR